MITYALLSALLGKAFAGVSEWQTMQTQNLLGVRPCGFKSRRRHYKKSRVFALLFLYITSRLNQCRFKRLDM